VIRIAAAAARKCSPRAKSSALGKNKLANDHKKNFSLLEIMLLNFFIFKKL